MQIPLIESHNLSEIVSNSLFLVGNDYSVVPTELISVFETMIGNVTTDISDDEDIIKNAINLMFWGI